MAVCNHFVGVYVSSSCTRLRRIPEHCRGRVTQTAIPLHVTGRSLVDVDQRDSRWALVQMSAAEDE